MEEPATPDFVKATPIQLNKYDPLKATVVEGYEYPVHDLVTGANVRVFVPASVHTVEGTNQLIEAALKPIRANIANNPAT